eukprot:TRINITY_DN25988_c0_g3_i1.p2 TRINITY_DN25988_c0_g3~~TRINITY_DN25988_c0_g3_i1.p2  ORF type:complete len:155 (+),score=27.39 TRINITY_DN25988_c0_g3_i1:157-621(+)
MSMSPSHIREASSYSQLAANTEFEMTAEKVSSDEHTEEEEAPVSSADATCRVPALQCLFVMVFTATCLCILGALGIVSPTGGLCPAEGHEDASGFLSCEVMQDVRALARLAFLPLVCCILLHGGGASCREEEERPSASSSPRSLDEIVSSTLLL